MSPTLNWYKVILVTTSSGPSPIPGRVLVHGERTVKNGTMMELRGVGYRARPKMEHFELYRRHLFDRDIYSWVDSVPAVFDHEPGYGYVAASVHLPLLARHPRILNRTFYFEDARGNPSTDISTARFGHFEVVQVELWGNVGVAGHIPSGSAKIHALIKPMMDPTVELGVLTFDGVKNGGNLFPERGYSRLQDLLYADIADNDDPNLERALIRSLQYQTNIDVTIEPSVMEIQEGDSGRCVVEIFLSGPGIARFAIQAVCSQGLNSSNELQRDDPIDDSLRDVIVSDVFTLTLDEQGVMVFD